MPDKSYNLQHLSLIFEKVSDLIFLMKIEGPSQYRCIQVNPSYLNVTGLKEEQVVGKRVEDILPEDLSAYIMNQYQKAIELKETIQYNEYLMVDHNRVVVETTLTPIINQMGECTHLLGVSRDLTQRLNTEEEQKRLLSIIEATPDFIATADAEGNVLFYNRSARKILGIGEDDDVSHLTIPETHPEWVRGMILEEALTVAKEKGYWSGESAFISSSGKETPVSQVIIAHKNKKGDVEYFSTVARDLTSEKRAEEKEKIAAKVFENIMDGVMITDQNNFIQFVNPAFTRITGYQENEVIGKKPRILSSGKHDTDFFQTMWNSIHKTGMWKGEIWNKKKNGELYLEEITINALKDHKGHVCNYVAIFKDITERKSLEEKLQFQALHDDLTKLPNRNCFYEQLNKTIEHASNTNAAFGVIFLDLDRFKEINDTLGHSAGDELLKAVADRLRQTVRQSDLVARLGGDEFVVILQHLNKSSDCIKVAEKIKDSFSKPFLLGDYDLYITPSMGISVYPDNGMDAETLVKHADTAMYQAKQHGKNTFKFFSSEFDDESFERLMLASDLRKAIDRTEFILHYQPQFSLHTGELVGFEALIRWNHPKKGMIPPGSFIPLAEETGMIIPIDQWVLREACLQNVKWQQQGYKPVRISVNLSMLQFQRQNVFELIQSILKDTGLDPHYLEIELTESIIMDNPEITSKNIQQLKTIGVQISLDDFGTHYSSLSYLKRLSLDRLKIDQSFMRDLADNKDDQIIVQTMIQLAHNLNLRVVAEGAEHQEHLEFLKNHRCDEVQGYYYSKPVPAMEAVKWIDKTF